MHALLGRRAFRPGRALLRGAMRVLALALSQGVHAADGEAIEYKFSTGIYRLGGGSMPSGSAVDLNLRASADWGNAWIAWFRSPVLESAQPRIGYDTVWRIGALRVAPSIQAASGGFAGGSVALETGESAFVGAGLGRTNLRDYFNLNFDPNDSWTASAGYRWAPQHYVAVQLVRDNRTHPDQQHIHLLYRQPLADRRRITVDLLYKRGLVDDAMVRRHGLTIGYDQNRWEVRLAYDPKVNFTARDMLRLTLATRF